MITIKTEEDKTDIHKFLSSQGANIDLTGTIVMTARENGTILALGALSMKDYRVFLDHIVVSGEYVEDLNLVLGLMKSLLNLADLRGMKTVYGSNPAMFDLYKMLRFKKSAGEAKKMYELSLEGYFTCENEEQ
ncbi:MULTISPECIES: hypothetical protein [Congzhengia]|uniref:Uncharacterized protein n=1 Tax=Congzhengia minquanensis TaxID=2763657 RepID=A0A926DNY7_9FIRM|nr:hypothetical protein [Congzhengia minquanensis]MBC8541846.1 hypothetical protein [Congzhengia minquanensis]